METSMFIARIVGPYCMIVALGALMNQKLYCQIFDEFIKNPALIYIRGALALIFGLMVLQYHNIWTFNPGIIITWMAWGAIIKGICLIIFPSSVSKAMEFYRQYPIFLVFILVSVLILGILLTIFGYLIEPGLLNPF